MWQLPESDKPNSFNIVTSLFLTHRLTNQSLLYLNIQNIFRLPVIGAGIQALNGNGILFPLGFQQGHVYRHSTTFSQVERETA